MRTHHFQEPEKSTILGEANVPVLHGPLSEDEQRLQEQEQLAASTASADAEYKRRQLDIAEASNRATQSNVRLTRLLTLFTAMGALAACYQGVVSNRSAKASLIAARASVDAAKVADETLKATLKINAEQAIAAEKVRIDSLKAARLSEQNQRASLQATINEFRDDQRAWLSFNGVAIRSFEPGKPLDISLGVTNTGKTPAFHVSAGMRADVTTPTTASHEQVDQYLLKVFSQPFPFTAKSIFSPGITQDSAIYKTDQNTQEMLKLIRSQKMHYYVMGRIDFDDISSRHQWMSYCEDIYYDAGILRKEDCRVLNDMSY